MVFAPMFTRLRRDLMAKKKYIPKTVNIDGVDYDIDYLERMDYLMHNELESLDAPIDSDEGAVSLHELLPTPLKNPYEMLLDKENELCRLLIQKAKQEPKRKGSISDIRVLQMLASGKTQTQIAERFDVSREAISKIVEKFRTWCIRLGYDPRLPSEKRPVVKKARKKGRK